MHRRRDLDALQDAHPAVDSSSSSTAEVGGSSSTQGVWWQVQHNRRGWQQQYRRGLVAGAVQQGWMASAGVDVSADAWGQES